MYQILKALAPHRIVPPQPRAEHFLRQTVQTGLIYPTLYVTRGEFESVDVPANRVTFFVMRDLRDTLISLYFSLRYSHPYDPYFARLRGRLTDMSQQDGLRFLMQHVLPDIAAIQHSWRDANVFHVRYEDLLADAENAFARIMDHAQIQVPDYSLARVVKRFSFEQRTGRKPGEEDAQAHLRKGIAGDWVNYLKGDLLAEFKARFDEALILTGYEANADWGMAKMQLPSRAEFVSCWCGETKLHDFSRDYSRCATCNTLVCTRIAVMGSEEDDVRHAAAFAGSHPAAPEDQMTRSGLKGNGHLGTLLAAAGMRIVDDLTDQRQACVVLDDPIDPAGSVAKPQFARYRKTLFLRLPILDTRDDVCNSLRRDGSPLLRMVDAARHRYLLTREGVEKVLLKDSGFAAV